MGGFTFKLFLDSGEDIGEFTSAVPNWQAGDELYNADHTRFRIVNVVYPEDLGGDRYAGLFVVSPVELAEPV